MLLSGIAASLMSTVYYVDSRRGSDSNAGFPASKPWRTLGRASKAKLLPGDEIRLAGGQSFKGTLRLGASVKGSRPGPVVVSSFGKGVATILAGKGHGITLDGSSFVRVERLKIVGIGRKRGSDGVGVRLRNTKYINLDRLDVSGFRIAGVETGGDQDTRITRVVAHQNGGCGITANSGWGNVPRTKRLYIGDCRVFNNPGDPKNLTNHSGNGILVGGADGALVEYCSATNNGWDMPWKDNGPVGIWTWNSDRVTIQNCISYGNRTTAYDGGGFDLDGGTTNSILQYNLSYNNEGVGLLVCQFEGTRNWGNNVIRYNISYNDGLRNFQSGLALYRMKGTIQGVKVYNNTIINPKHAIATMGDIPGAEYRNNVFVASDALICAPYQSGGYTKSLFSSNLYGTTGNIYWDEKEAYSNLKAWDRDPTGIAGDPRLLLPKVLSQLPTNPRKLASMPWFRPLPGSPCLNAGDTILPSGTRDLRGTRIGKGIRPSIGAIQR